MLANCLRAISRGSPAGLELCKCVFLKRSNSLTNFYLAGSLLAGIAVCTVGPDKAEFCGARYRSSRPLTLPSGKLLAMANAKARMRVVCYDFTSPRLTGAET